MPRFVLERHPPHWLFVPSKRQVRELLAELDADVRWIEFYGTGPDHSTDRLSIGFVESLVIEGSWCFYLHLWGVRESVAGPVREEFAAAALAEIGEYIRKCVSAPAADVFKPAQLYLSFRVESVDVHPECRVSPVGKISSFPTGSWWVRKPTTAPDVAPDGSDT
jgi:hypothetical protein